ncbi:PEGA domain-containing protein [Polyangium sorediatum]|uniref:PEGA domain-containing protein n=1 Tax=Polyangium sorediatum TaxID=889274 RepID=A0ABT6NVG2_9BACT|nr:PEGA domain-containing protein [Polyangium sorediatum]MDI1432322.1 PEGA domain-containing protein [Polyangium sorediatum]
MRTKALLSTVSFALLLAGSAPAYADDAARAAELFATGNKLFDEEKWAEAEASYQAAWDLRKSFDLAGNLGDVEMTLGQFRDAAEHLSYALEEFPAGGKPEVREALQKRLDEAKKQVGTVTIGTNIGGAKIFVDGRLVGQAPLAKAVFVDPGKRVIEAKLPGHDDVLRTVDVEKAQSQEVNLVLAPKIGGAPGGKSKVLIGVGGGLALVGIGAGIGLLVAASGADSDAKALDSAMPDAACDPAHPDHAANKGNCATLLSTLQRKDTFTNIGTGALIAGGVLAVGTVVYALLPTKKQATMGFTLVPTVTPTFAGFAATGQF